MASGTFSTAYTGIPSLLYHPEVRPNLIARYRDDDFMDLLDQMKRWRKINRSQFYTAYEGPLYEIVDTTGATVATSGTATITVTVLPIAQAVKLIKGRMVILNNGTGGQARVDSVTTTGGGTTATVVLKSSAAGAPNITLVAGQNIIPYSNAQEEGSLQPDPQRYSMDTFYNITQSFRHTGRITDFQRAQQDGGTFAITINGQRQFESWQTVKSLMAHRADIANGLLLNEMSDSNVGSSSPTLIGEQLYGVNVTRGLIPTIGTYGWTSNLTTPGTVVQADIEAIVAAIVAARGVSEYLVVCSTATIMKLSNFFALGGVTPVRMNISVDKASKINLMVDQYTLGGITFNLKSLNALDNQQIITTTNVYSKTAYFIPMGSGAAYDRGGGNSRTQDYLSVAYEPIIRPGDGTEKQALVHLGALAERPTNGTAVEDWVYQTICGLDVVMPYIFGRSRILA